MVFLQYKFQNMRRSIFFIVFALSFFSCRNANNPKNDINIKSDYIKYAKGFSIDTTDSPITVTVYDLLGKVISYKLCTGNKNESCRGGILIPIKRAVCMSSTHVGFMGVLNAQPVIVGISGTDYVNNPHVWERIAEGEIAEVGYDQSLNYELVSRLKPDVIFAYGVSSESSSFIGKLKELGLQVVIVPDYLETSPLGRAEWIKFFGAFLGKQNLADSIFSVVESNYKRLSQITQSVSYRPKVFLNLPFKDIWYFPGSENYFAQFINDAGGNYVFPELQGSRSHPVSTEVAYRAGLECDVWLNPGTAISLSDITDTDLRFADFKAFQTGMVYNNYKRIGPGGGNDFWESGVVHPDFILRDLIKIFHPALLPNDSLYFYKQLER